MLCATSNRTDCGAFFQAHSICDCDIVIVTNVCGKHFSLLVVIEITMVIVTDNNSLNKSLLTQRCYSNNNVSLLFILYNQ